MSSGFEFKPRILGFLCNWCCYGGADLAGVSRFQYPPYIRVIRVMCSGRVDLAHVLRAFSDGIDGVFIGGCHLNDCHYNTEGNYDALSMMHLCRKLLEHVGINSERLRLAWVSAGEGIRFSEIMSDFGDEIKKLGPLGTSEEIDKSELRSRIEAVVRLIPYIKLMQKNELSLHVPDEEKYSKLYTNEEIDRLIRDAPSYYIDPAKCKACMLCARRCPAEAIVGGKQKIHVIDQEKCIKCGTCLEACPPRFGAVTKLTGEPVPISLPEGERTVIRESKKRMAEVALTID